MVLLIHHPVSPFSRKARVMMGEKRMLFVLKEVEPWKITPDIFKLNPAGVLPILVSDGKVISGNYAVTEYLEEISQDIKLMPADIVQKAEVRRLTEWFDNKFHREVYKNIVMEKVHKRFSAREVPDSKILKIGFNNLNFHLEYIEWLVEQRGFLAGENLTVSDIATASHLSVIDYLGDIPWEEFPTAKLWYSKIKSRPSFKEILRDNIKGILPSKHYADLDF